MGIRDWFRRKPKEGDRLAPGRTTAVVGGTYGALSPHSSRTMDVLEDFRDIKDEVEALDFLRKQNPDVSMAVWNFIRLANQGHEMNFYGLNSRAKGRRLEEVEARWRDVAARVNSISNDGLDGLMNQLHFSAFMRKAQAIEVEIAQSLDDIEDVYVIDPQTIEWEYDKEQKRWVPYQQQNLKRVDLSGANFFWVPTDPDIDDPRGNLVMGSVLQAIDFQMQVLQDLQQVIHNQGWPRYDIKLLLDRVMMSMPPQVKADPKARKEWLADRVSEIEKHMRGLKPDDSFVHFDDMEMGKTQGGEVTRSVDVRAIGEMLDQQTMSGTKQMGTFMNRINGSTETWSTVQFRIFVSGIASIQRGSKRLIEEVARLWLRTQGIQAKPIFTHNTIDWQSEQDKVNVKLLWQQYWAIAQLMGWTDGDRAASETIGIDKAAGKPVEGARVSFSSGGGQVGYGDGPGIAGGNPDRANSKEGRVLRIFGGDSAKGGD